MCTYSLEIKVDEEMKPEVEMSFNGLLTGMLRREIGAIMGRMWRAERSRMEQERSMIAMREQ